jgi:hypothetical protein
MTETATAPAKKVKAAKPVLEVTHTAERFAISEDAGVSKNTLKGLWVVDGGPGLYSFKANLKPHGEAPVLTEGEVMANYVMEDGKTAPATFVRLTALENALRAQIG